MITILRKNQRVLMLFIAVLTIIAFIWLYNPATTKELGSNTVATMYGRTISQADVEREVKSFQLALALGQFRLLEDLGGMARDENRALDEFIWNRLVMHHQAKELGIEPTDSQIASHIKAVPVFQTNGQFDPVKYKTFLLEQLGPRGFTELQLENVIRDALRVERIKAIVGAPVAASEAEIREVARVYEKVNAQEVRFSLAASERPSDVTDEEVKSFYEQNGPALIMPETRSVSYVKFAPPAGEKPLEGREKVDALQKVADAASAFAERALSDSFEKAAAESGQTIQASPDFDRSGATLPAGGEVSQAPGPDLKNLAPSAFLLTDSSPISDANPVRGRLFCSQAHQGHSAAPLNDRGSPPDGRAPAWRAQGGEPPSRKSGSGACQDSRSDVRGKILLRCSRRRGIASSIVQRSSAKQWNAITRGTGGRRRHRAHGARAALCYDPQF